MYRNCDGWRELFRGNALDTRTIVNYPKVVRVVMNIQKMMKQAQEMQDPLQRELAATQVEATAGGGMVTVVMTGVKQLRSVTIDPEVVSKDDVEMLQDLIVAAINDAQRKVDDEVSGKMGGMMGGLKIPGLTG